MIFWYLKAKEDSWNSYFQWESDLQLRWTQQDWWDLPDLTHHIPGNQSLGDRMVCLWIPYIWNEFYSREESAFLKSLCQLETTNTIWGGIFLKQNGLQLSIIIIERYKTRLSGFLFWFCHFTNCINLGKTVLFWDYFLTLNLEWSYLANWLQRTRWM